MNNNNNNNNIIINAVIVTRHLALVEHLRLIGIATGESCVIEHATREDVEGRDVVGVLPLSLACYANSITEIPLSLPLELRGKELSIEDVQRFAGAPVTYRVTRQ